MMTTTTIAMAMATMAVNDYGYNGDDGNDDDDDDDDDEDAKLLLGESICMVYIQSVLMHSRVDRFALEWADSADGVFVALR